MTEPLANKIGVANQGTVYNQTNHVTITEDQKTQLVYSSPLPNRERFQGRKTELEKLGNWLQDETTILIGIRGEGGIGKSTLAAKTFDDCLGFASKCWIDVRTGTSIIEVAERALQEFGMSPAQMQTIEKKDLPQRLLRKLQNGRFLLGIDNLESLLSHQGNWQDGYEEFLESFVELDSTSIILLASREYPPKYFKWLKSQWLTLEQGLEPIEGAALLQALEAEGTDEERARISENVNGNPLALSLLAGWLREEFRPGERSVLHLNEQLDLFAVEGRHRNEKQVSLQSVFDWSFHRLSAETQFLLSQVSVLRGSFNREAASTLVERVVEDSELHDLERRSLLQELPISQKDGFREYRLQPRIQDFAQKKAGNLTIAHDLAIQYYWENRKLEFQSNDNQEAAREYLETFYHEFILGRYENATQTIFACDEFLSRRGYNQILIDSYQSIYDKWQPTVEQYQNYSSLCINLGVAYDSLGEYQRTIDYYQQSLTIKREIGDRNGEANSLIGLGNAYDSLGQYPRAIDYQEQSLTIKREIGDRNGEANSLIGLGNAYYSLGQYPRAIDYYEQSLNIKQEIGDRNSEANSLIGLGNAYDSLGQYPRAIDYYEQSLTIKREIGDRKGEANSLGNLGNAYDSLGQYPRAIDYYEQSLTIQREIGDRKGEANSLGNLGNAYNSLGQYPRAIDYQEQSLTITREIGDRNGEAISLGNLGNAYNSLGQYPRAIDYQEQSLTIKREIGDRNGEANSLIGLGNAYYSLGQYPRAIDYYEQSLTIKREIGDRKGEAISLGNLGNAYDSLGQYPRAIDYQEQSLTIKREIGDRNGEARSLYNKALSLEKLNRRADALQYFQQALIIYLDLNLEQEVKICKTEIAKFEKSDFLQLLQFLQTFPLWFYFIIGLVIAFIIWWIKK